MLRVVKGEPTAEELAALVAVISARHAAAAVEPPQVRRSGWSARDRSLRGVHRAGPGGWRASARPR
ncbi:MAG: acyl-CoA carboxylase subunit epsilon [Actinomycetota bacterium]|nr:acyl-CoA carboxylase subunit epsilon [Actinomycetota bacterium]